MLHRQFRNAQATYERQQLLHLITGNRGPFATWSCFPCPPAVVGRVRASKLRVYNSVSSSQNILETGSPPTGTGKKPEKKPVAVYSMSACSPHLILQVVSDPHASTEHTDQVWAFMDERLDRIIFQSLVMDLRSSVLQPSQKLLPLPLKQLGVSFWPSHPSVFGMFLSERLPFPCCSPLSFKAACPGVWMSATLVGWVFKIYQVRPN